MKAKRKVLHVSARKVSMKGKFQVSMEPNEVLEIDEIAERWADSHAIRPNLARSMIRSLEEYVMDALADGCQLNFGLVSFYPRLSGGLTSRDADPESENLYVRGAVKARRSLVYGLKNRVEAVNSLSAVRPRFFSIFDSVSQKFDVVASGRELSAVGTDIDIDSSRSDEGVWLERRKKNGYEKFMKARLVSSDSGKAVFVFEDEMPLQKCSVAIYTRSGRSTDYKVLVCRREVAVIE